MNKKKNDKSSQIKNNKKDSVGLFSGQYKATEIEPKINKPEKYKKTLKDYLNEED